MNGAFVVLAFALAGSRPAAAALSEADAGTSTGLFLRLGASAREAAMGEAGTAAAYSPAALHYNPAGIAYVPRFGASFLYSSHLAGSSYQYAAFVQRLRPRLAWGASLRHFSAGDVTTRDSAGFQTGSISPRDLGVTFGAAGFLDRKGLGPLSGSAVGGTLTWVESRLSRSASTLTGGLGLRTRPFFDSKLRFGLSAENLFGSLTYDLESDPLPRVARLGLLATPWREWDVSLQLDLPADGPPAVAFGTEYSLGPLALRAGYLNRGEAEPGGLAGFSGGFGVGWRGTMVDYALVPFGPLGDAHRFSLTLRW